MRLLSDANTKLLVLRAMSATTKMRTTVLQMTMWKRFQDLSLAESAEQEMIMLMYLLHAMKVKAERSEERRVGKEC